MRTIQINKIYCVKTPTAKKLVICKRHESSLGEPNWSDVEQRTIDSKLEDEIISATTQMATPHLDTPIVICDTQGHEYSMTYRNNQLTTRSLYQLFSKFLEKPMTVDEFATKTKCKIALI